MWRTVFRIHIVDERIDMEIILFTSHVGERRRFVHFRWWTPDKEVTILIGKEIDIETIIQQFHSHIRLMISESPSHTETFVVSLLAVSFVSEKIDSSADIEIADTTGVGEVESFVNRIPYTAKKTSAQDRFNRIFIIFPETLVAPLVFVVFRITIYSHISTETCFRSQSRTCSTDVDNAVQGWWPVQHGGSSFNNFHLFYIF